MKTVISKYTAVNSIDFYSWRGFPILTFIHSFLGVVALALDCGPAVVLVAARGLRVAGGRAAVVAPGKKKNSLKCVIAIEIYLIFKFPS